MKFTNGLWLLRKEYTPVYAVEYLGKRVFDDELIAKKLGIDTDFMAIKNFICRWAPSRYFLCADNLLELLSDIKSAYQECQDEGLPRLLQA